MGLCDIRARAAPAGAELGGRGPDAHGARGLQGGVSGRLKVHVDRRPDAHGARGAYGEGPRHHPRPVQAGHRRGGGRTERLCRPPRPPPRPVRGRKQGATRAGLPRANSGMVGDAAGRSGRHAPGRSNAGGEPPDPAARVAYGGRRLAAGGRPAWAKRSDCRVFHSSCTRRLGRAAR